MTLRTIFTTEQGVNPPAFGKIPGQDAYYPLLQVDDTNGMFYNGGVPLSGANSLMYANPAVITLSASDLLNLKATPKVLIPSLGAGFAISVYLATFQFKAVSATYTLGSATGLYIGSATNPLVLNTVQPIPATILDGSSGPGNVFGIAPGANAIVALQSWFESQDLVLTHNGSTELSAGDGTAVVKVYHTVAAL